jgi:hypothetical protein
MPRRVVVFDLGTPLPGFARSIDPALALRGFPERAPADLARFIGPPRPRGSPTSWPRSGGRHAQAGQRRAISACTAR